MEFDQVKVFCSRCQERVSCFLSSDHRLMLWLGFKGAYCPRCHLDITTEAKEKLSAPILSLLLASWIGRGIIAVLFAVILFAILYFI